MDTKLDKSNTIRLDVYELKDHKPVLTYRINVFDKIILSVDNNDIPPRGATKCVNEPIKEYLEITPLTPIENLDYASQLTHKFQIKRLGWKNLFLNLTDNDLIKLGFKEKPPVVKLNLNENKRWIIGLIVMGAIGIAAIIFNYSKGSKTTDIKDIDQVQQEEKITPSAIQLEFSQSDSLTVPVDSTNILKNDSLTKKLK